MLIMDSLPSGQGGVAAQNGDGVCPEDAVWAGKHGHEGHQSRAVLGDMVFKNLHPGNMI